MCVCAFTSPIIRVGVLGRPGKCKRGSLCRHQPSRRTRRRMVGDSVAGFPRVTSSKPGAGCDQRHLPLNGATPSRNPYGDSPAILISNDDGLDPGAAIVLDLAAAMVRKGHRVVVCAPSKNNSACGQKITLGKEMQLQRHRDLEKSYGGSRNEMLSIYSLEDGSPADCVIVAIEAHTGILAQLGLRPKLMLSGINVGPNLGPDIGYSGTYAAARQAAMYGIPAVASSLAAFGKRAHDAEYESSCQSAVVGIARLAAYLLETLPDELPDAGRFCSDAKEQKAGAPKVAQESALTAVRHAFAIGDVMVNVNIPAKWDGEFEACVLDGVLYRDVVKWGSAGSSVEDKQIDVSGRLPSGLKGDEVAKLTIAGGRMKAMYSDGSDALATSLGRAAICTLSTWPTTHPFAVSPALLAAGLITGAKCAESHGVGIPSWMLTSAQEPAKL